ncbi:ATP-binding cassette domain-containing protein [bacterium]|nr:ATP-binding cassette domain-containing protein [bacterium]
MSDEIVWKLDNVRAGYSASEDRFEGVSFTIERGERVAFLGTAKSGRKLLMKVMCGLRPPRAGTMQIFDHTSGADAYYRDWDDLLPRRIKAKLGVALEVDGLLSNVSIREGYELLFRFRYGDHNERLQAAASKVVDGLCEQFSLNTIMHKRPVELSPSERKLACIARAFLARPRVLLLENPSENIGQLSQMKLWSMIDAVFENQERTIILSTEDFRLAWRHCPRWMVFDKGNLVFDGQKEDFIKTRHPVLKLIDPVLFPR